MQQSPQDLDRMYAARRMEEDRLGVAKVEREKAEADKAAAERKAYEEKLAQEAKPTPMEMERQRREREAEDRRTMGFLKFLGGMMLAGAAIEMGKGMANNMAGMGMKADLGANAPKSPAVGLPEMKAPAPASSSGKA